jgi:hypothetical protein
MWLPISTTCLEPPFIFFYLRKFNAWNILKVKTTCSITTPTPNYIPKNVVVNYYSKLSFFPQIYNMCNPSQEKKKIYFLQVKNHNLDILNSNVVLIMDPILIAKG